jgi:hypothetical protein
VLEVLQKLQFSVGSFGEDWGAEGLHDLLDGNVLVRQLVAGGAAREKALVYSREAPFLQESSH